MKNTFLKVIGGAVLAILMLMMFAQVRVSAQFIITEEQNKEQIEGNRGARALEGSWSTQVTIRNCQTGDAIRTFPRMNTFMQGGTMQEFSAAVAPSLRGPGHGVWSHLSERITDGQRFSYAIQFFRFNADGSFAGKVRERRNVEVDFFGSTYNATGTGEIFDANGNLIATACATETGTRFE